MIGLVNADTRRIPLADKSVHTVATSPPYWSLRDYGIAGQLGMEPLHDCLAWARGERPCAECYVCAMRLVAAEIWRVLRDDGTYWLNLGDSYATRYSSQRNRGRAGFDEYGRVRGGEPPKGLKNKDLVGIPWRVALALQADGWYLRSDCIWSKPNPMPESVKDRPTRSHEYVFLLTKSARYFYDIEAIKEPLAESSIARVSQPNFNNQTGGPKDCANGTNANRSMRQTLENFAAVVRFGGNKSESHDGRTYSGNEWDPDLEGGRNARTVWELATEPYSGAHFATWPTALVEKMILAGTSAAGCCPTCSAPHVRITHKEFVPQPDIKDPEKLKRNGAAMDPSSRWGGFERGSIRTETLNWRPSCKCMRQHTLRIADGIGRTGEEWLCLAEEAAREFAPVPCTVLDPFAGSGTTGVVARKHGRHFIGLDLSFSYLRDQARTRLGLAALEAFENGAAVHDPNDYSDLFKATT